jgi:hypothetical protein
MEMAFCRRFVCHAGIEGFYLVSFFSSNGGVDRDHVTYPAVDGWYLLYDNDFSKSNLLLSEFQCTLYLRVMLYFQCVSQIL